MHYKFSTLFFFCLANVGFHSSQAQHNFEWYNDGALVHVQAGAEVHVWGDAHNYQATGDLQNNGLIKVQGNLYSDALFQQSGTGTTLLENSDVNTNERQFISGSYAVRGGSGQIGVNDGSFYDLELNNSQGAVYLVNSGTGSTPQYVADVRNSVNFDPQGLGPANATNIITHDIGLTGAISYPTNGSAYTAKFGMMNSTAGSGFYYNDTWHQSGGNNMSTMDKGYVVGHHRRAISPAGGDYGYMLGLDPSTNVLNNGTNKGFQYIQFSFGANNYDVLSGYYEAQSANNTMGAGIECSGYDMNDFWGNRHGEWIFDDINSIMGGDYEVTVWPQDPITPWSGSVYTISKDDVFLYPASSPLHNDCGPTPVGLSRSGFNGFSQFGIVSGVIILETEIVELKATPINNKYIHVDWSTSKESALDYFVIERSTDDANFSAIAQHSANGNTTYLSEYAIDDHAVLPNVNYYYRIKLVNTDGSFDYTHSVVASLATNGNTETVNLFPNPLVEGDATVEIVSLQKKDAVIVVYDAIGQLICKKEISVSTGVNTYTLATNDWPGAVYYVHIKDAQSSTIKELIKSE